MFEKIYDILDEKFELEFWKNKNVSLRFKIANWILGDELRWLLISAKHDAEIINRYQDPRVAEKYSNKLVRRINSFWEIQKGDEHERLFEGSVVWSNMGVDSWWYWNGSHLDDWKFYILDCEVII